MHNCWILWLLWYLHFIPSRRIDKLSMRFSRIISFQSVKTHILKFPTCNSSRSDGSQLTKIFWRDAVFSCRVFYNQKFSRRRKPARNPFGNEHHCQHSITQVTGSSRYRHPSSVSLENKHAYVFHTCISLFNRCTAVHIPVFNKHFTITTLKRTISLSGKVIRYILNWLYWVYQ